MVISYQGGECFKITQGDLTLSLNPPSKDSSLKSPKFGSDIVLSSLNHEDFNGVETASSGDRAPFVITGPGEYERAWVTVRGFPSAGPDGAINTIYSVELEDMILVHLGALSEEDLPAEAREGIDEVDVLFVPIGASAGQAHAIAVALGPKIIVPMGWNEKSLDAFLKAAGSALEKAERLTLKKRDLVGKEGSILVLTP